MIIVLDRIQISFPVGSTLEFQNYITQLDTTHLQYKIMLRKSCGRERFFELLKVMNKMRL